MSKPFTRDCGDCNGTGYVYDEEKEQDISCSSCTGTGTIIDI